MDLHVSLTQHVLLLVLRVRSQIPADYLTISCSVITWYDSRLRTRSYTITQSTWTYAHYGAEVD